ncbi:MAG: Fic family protein [Anaerolineae bacterium]|nr:Fic family protein [Anaerolineae bacterium]
MNKNDFHAPETGKVIITPKGYLAFIPSPLPPAIKYTSEVVLSLSRADAALSELSGLGKYLPNPHLLTNAYIRREAVLSSRIEGTRAGLSDMWLEEFDPKEKESKDPDLNEVKNYVVAMEFGIQRLIELPLSLRLIREIHEKLMKGVRGDHATPGEFRRSQNWIGPAGSTLSNATYVPPPPEEMKACLANWEDYLQNRNQFPELIQCALLHEQFEAIHPFLDGNGRVGRLLITLFLIERGRLTQPLLYLSSYFESHRQEYYTYLQKVKTDGDWNNWILFFLNGVTETAQQAARQANQITALREKYLKELRETPKAVALIDPLFQNPYMTIARATQLLNITHPTARQVIKVLEDAGVLQEVTGREWGRIYKANEISRTIESPK